MWLNHLSISEGAIDKKPILNFNKSRELNNDIVSEGLADDGEADDIHSSTMFSCRDKSYEDECHPMTKAWPYPATLELNLRQQNQYCMLQIVAREAFQFWRDIHGLEVFMMAICKNVHSEVILVLKYGGVCAGLHSHQCGVRQRSLDPVHAQGVEAVLE